MHVASTTKRRRLYAATILTVLGSVLAPGMAAQQAMGELIASGQSPDLFLLYTGDVIGYIEPCG